LIEVLKTYRIW